MPVYNGERYLSEAVDSIRNQTLADFEFVIVNDGSVDRSADMLAYYAKQDRRIHVIHQANGGIVSALNVGLARCDAPYIARMDADDISKPNRFEVQVAHLDKHLECVAVGGAIIGINEAGEHSHPYNWPRNKVTSLDSFPARVALTLHPLAMFRREPLIELGGYRSTFPHAEDYDLFLRLARYGRIDNPRIVLMYYRDHRQSVSRRNICLQECAMGYAELAAIAAHRGLSDLIKDGMDFSSAQRIIDSVFEPLAVKAYLEFRMWRRLKAFDPAAARAMRARVLDSVFSLSPEALLSRDYWALRRRITGHLISSGLSDLLVKICKTRIALGS